MAIDNTPPRLKLIITIAAITVVTLVSLDFVFRSYYGFMTDEAQRAKLAAPKDLAAHHAQEEMALKGAAVPLDQAMAQLAKGTRADIVAPKQSDDPGALTGWSKLPKPVPTPETHGAAPATAPTGPEPTNVGDAGALPPSANVDGGSITGADAGAQPVRGGGALAGDAGTHPQPPGMQLAPKKGAPHK